MRRKILLLTLCSLFMMLLISGCGRDDENSKGTSVYVKSGLEDGAKEKESSQSAPLKKFAINAYQFAFEPDIIEVDEGDEVLITITSTDVGHGFALPDFGINRKIPPEESVTVTFMADKSGEFEFFSSVYSGKGWKNMTGKLVVKKGE